MKGIFGKIIIVVMWIVVAVGIYNAVVIKPREEKTYEVGAETVEELKGMVGEYIAEEKIEETNIAELESIEVTQEVESMELVSEEFIAEQDSTSIEEQEALTKIRVLLMTTGYQGIYHDELQLSSNEDFSIVMDGVEYLHSSMESVSIPADRLTGKSMRVCTRDGGELILSNIERHELVSYRGELECFGTENGIVVVNELPVEEYLYGVVPSEMPASYPMAALEAQAISARTYTYYHMKNYAYPEWEAHVDDSTAYQVYKNLQENEAVCQAVDSTIGQVITYQGELIESFYYSTSCGLGAGYEVWGSAEEKPYLQVKEYTLEDGEDYIEKEEPWYRWCCQLDVTSPKELLTLAYEYGQSNPDKIEIVPQPKSLDSLLKDTVIYDIQCEQNERNSLVTAITIKTKNYSICVESQQLVRKVLALPDVKVTKQDGSEYQVGDLLPSAYFEMDKLYEGKQLTKLSLSGGGMGHGVGMSQNGAKCLAHEGFCAEEIVKYYYEGVEVEIHDENIM